MYQFFRKLRKLSILLRVPIWRKALMKSVPATTEHLHIFSFEPFATVIDVGANRGQFSLLAKGLYPSVKVFAFEPLQAPREIFEAVSAGWNDITIFPFGLGDENIDEMSINVASKNDSSSFLAFEKISDMFPSAQFSHQEIASIKRLDDVLKPNGLVAPVLMKIDVQGFEKQVLTGSEKLLPHIDLVYVEAAFVDMYKNQALFDEIYAFLSDKGFYLKRIGHVSGGRGHPGSYGDFLFARQ